MKYCTWIWSTMFFLVNLDGASLLPPGGSARTHSFTLGSSTWYGWCYATLAQAICKCSSGGFFVATGTLAMIWICGFRHLSSRFVPLICFYISNIYTYKYIYFKYFKIDLLRRLLLLLLLQNYKYHHRRGWVAKEGGQATSGNTVWYLHTVSALKGS